jgi:hypothetical protein
VSKASRKSPGEGNVADQVAEFIGRTMGELLNKRDSLSRQMADVERQISDVRQRVVKQFGEYIPTPRERRKVKRAVSRRVAAGTAAAREVSEATREKMAAAARKRWARVRAGAKKAAKAKA